MQPQVHYESWLSCSRSARAGGEPAQQPQRAQRPLARLPSFDGIDSPHAALLSRQHLPGGQSPAHSPSHSFAEPAGAAGAAAGAQEGPGALPHASHTTQEFLAVEVPPAGAATAPTAPAAQQGPHQLQQLAGGVPTEAPEPSQAEVTAAAAGPALPPLEPPSALPPLELPPRGGGVQRALAGPATAAGAAQLGGNGCGASGEAAWGAGGNGGLGLWRPLQYNQQYTWRRVDWLRYYLFRQGSPVHA